MSSKEEEGNAWPAPWRFGLKITLERRGREIRTDVEVDGMIASCAYDWSDNPCHLWISPIIGPLPLMRSGRSVGAVGASAHGCRRAKEILLPSAETEILGETSLEI